MKFRERYAEPTIWLLINITLAAGLVFALSGCTSDQIKSYQADRAAIETARVATTQAIAQTQVEIAKLPPDDPVRRALESNVQRLSEVADQADKALKAVDAAIIAAQTGDTESLRAAAVERADRGHIRRTVSDADWLGDQTQEHVGPAESTASAGDTDRAVG